MSHTAWWNGVKKREIERTRKERLERPDRQMYEWHCTHVQVAWQLGEDYGRVPIGGRVTTHDEDEIIHCDKPADLLRLLIASQCLWRDDFRTRYLRGKLAKLHRTDWRTTDKDWYDYRWDEGAAWYKYNYWKPVDPAEKEILRLVTHRIKNDMRETWRDYYRSYRKHDDLGRRVLNAPIASLIYLMGNWHGTDFTNINRDNRD